ncbi:MAG: hypothetical protein CVU64_15925 [Deltaproteobacteria bacterium HGW-Deltaproteobacteria-21]|nr:MAG: hypothetical protein CVU64_15925 [Deltaproteobacteria bacterium HGW-Deltaproteobacteria-21]
MTTHNGCDLVFKNIQVSAVGRKYLYTMIFGTPPDGGTQALTRAKTSFSNDDSSNRCPGRVGDDDED